MIIIKSSLAKSDVWKEGRSPYSHEFKVKWHRYQLDVLAQKVAVMGVHALCVRGRL